MIFHSQVLQLYIHILPQYAHYLSSRLYLNCRYFLMPALQLYILTQYTLFRSLAFTHSFAYVAIQHLIDRLESTHIR